MNNLTVNNNTVGHAAFSTYTKLSEKLTFLALDTRKYMSISGG